MKASIVIPAHNEERVIEAVIQAALAQDYPDFEVIVVDNLCTDRTADIALRYPVKVVREDNAGLLWARERGRISATGQIIANIDADCLPEKDWLSRGISNFTNDKIVAVTGPYDYYDGNESFRKFSLWFQKYIYYYFSKLIQFSFKENGKPLIGGAVLIGGNNFIRAEVLKKAGGYNTALTFYGEDTDTAKRVSKFGYVVFNTSLTMKTSARRFKQEGIIATEARYLFHFFKHIFFK